MMLNNCDFMLHKKGFVLKSKKKFIILKWPQMFYELECGLNSQLRVICIQKIGTTELAQLK